MNLSKASETSPYLAVCSTDGKFMCRLIDWLNSQKCEPNSTVIRVNDMDPFEELDLRMGQIEGMTVRIQEAETLVSTLQEKLGKYECPSCGTSEEVVECHHDGETCGVPECDYKYCNHCFHQWGHS